MKKLVFVCAVVMAGLFVLPLKTKAQEQQTSSENTLTPKLGFKAGLNLTNMYVQDVSDENMKVGLTAGFIAKLPLSRGFSIQPELLYSNKGAKETYNNLLQGEGEYRFNLHYIEMPVLAVINLGSNFNIHGGPYIAYLAGVDIKDMNDDGSVENIDELNAENFHRVDYGLAAGFGVDISNLTLGARYSYGLHEIGKSGSLSGELTKDSKNSAISLYIGFGF